jgi:hypothetical protein
MRAWDCISRVLLLRQLGCCPWWYSYCVITWSSELSCLQKVAAATSCFRARALYVHFLLWSIQALFSQQQKFNQSLAVCDFSFTVAA